MKTPKSQTVSSKSRSVSEQQLQKSKLVKDKPVSFKLIEKQTNSQCFASKQKSETCIKNNPWTLEKLPLSNTSSETQLIPSPKTPKYPKDVLRKSLIKIKSAQWNESVLALRDIVQISRYNPQLLEKSMPIIFKGIIHLLKSLRTTAARTAAQVANELFMNMSFEDGPEFVDLVHVLLQKSVDANKYLKEDALEALDSMVIHVPPSRSIKVLLHKRIAGYNLNVRKTASKLLACVLNESDADYATSLNEETKTRLVLTALRFLQDDCKDIKFHGMRLVTALMHHKDFEKTFQTKISIEILSAIDKIIKTVKRTNGYRNI